MLAVLRRLSHPVETVERGQFYWLTKPSSRDCRKGAILLAGFRARGRGSGGRARSSLQSGHYHKPLGSGTDVIGRIASDEGEARILSRISHGNVVGSNNRLTDHYVVVFPGPTTDVNVVSLGEFVNMTQETVAMSGNHGITGISGPSRVL